MSKTTRRGFLGRALGLTAASLVPWKLVDRVEKTADKVSPSPVSQPVPAAPSVPTTQHQKAEVRMCANCGLYPAREGSRVCSPICNWWSAEHIIASVGLLGFQHARQRSHEIMGYVDPMSGDVAEKTIAAKAVNTRRS